MAWITLCDVPGVEEFVDRVQVVDPAATGRDSIYGSACVACFREPRNEPLADHSFEPHKGTNTAQRRERFDHELRRRVFNYLSLRGIPGLESIKLTVTNGNVRLDGTTPSRTAKWRCSECCTTSPACSTCLTGWLSFPLTWMLNLATSGQEAAVSGCPGKLTSKLTEGDE